MPSAVPAAPVLEDLTARPGAYAFAQAVRIVARGMRAGGHEPGPDSFRFRKKITNGNNYYKEQYLSDIPWSFDLKITYMDEKAD